ncbi:MAG: DNA polymerase III subunit alpha, partial [Termitinemataceae bacterium]
MNIRLGLISAYSLLYGVHSPRDIVMRAKDLGIQYLSITDRNSLYGIHEFLEAAEEASIHPIIGSELLYREGSVYAFVLEKSGFSRLCEILSILADRKQKSRGGNSISSISSNSLSGGLSKTITYYSGDGKSETSGMTREDMGALLAEDSGGLALATEDPSLLELLDRKNLRVYGACGPRRLRVLQKARKLDIPLLALDASLFFNSSDYSVHRVLRAIALGKTLGTLTDNDCISSDEIASRMFENDGAFDSFCTAWPEAAQGTENLVRMVRCTNPFDGYVFPQYPAVLADEPYTPNSPPGVIPYETTRSRSTAEEILRRRVFLGAEQRYGELNDAILDRIHYELDIINQKGFASYFLCMHDIVCMANRTCGRGSGAASIVSYALGITNVDPIAYDLYFERFLNPSRQDPPDIDVDFPWDERDALIQKVIAHFGVDHCARVANHNRFRFRSALRETAKAYGFSDLEISELEGQLVRGNRSMKDLHNHAQWVEVLELAQRLENLPRGLSMHCGGLVITPGPIRRYAPIEHSAGEHSHEYPLLAWEKEGTEAAGLVKLDLLGNRSLAVIRDALINLSEDGIVIDFIRTDPAQDPETIMALARGDTLGVFYIESPAMRQLQKKTGRGDFKHIVIHSSIIRPAAHRFIDEYVRRLHGAPYHPVHPRLERVLAETYGIMCYQEDVSKVAVALASFSEADADGLRKIIAKKAGGSRLAAYKDRFYEGCRKNSIPTTVIDEVWEMMLSFDGYSFNKPHSASYAMVSFQSAYLRVHYPAYFMAAVLSNQGGYYHPQAYISECRRMGIQLFGPDINESQYRYYAKGNRLVIGLMAIRGLSKRTSDAIMSERQRKGLFYSLEDVARRVQLPKDELAQLCEAGVFDSLASGLPRSIQFRVLITEGIAASTRVTGACSLFDAGYDECGASLRASIQASVQSERETLCQTKYRTSIVALDRTPVKVSRAELIREFECLGFLRSHHPFELWKATLQRFDRIYGKDLPHHVGKRVCLAGWPITRKEVWTRQGEPMDFISYEDETALFETVLFPQVYQQYR